jgi:HK97 family phage portal protein
MATIGNYYRTASSTLRHLFSGRGGGGQVYAQRARVVQTSRFDWAREAGDPRENAVVALGLDWMIRNAQTVKLKLYSKPRFGSEEVEVEDHPILDLLRNPNPIYGGRAIVDCAMVDVMTVGDAFWYIAETNRGQPGELYWFDCRYMSPNFPTGGTEYLHGWKYSAAGVGIPEEYDPPEIIQFKKGLDPINDRLGYSPLAAVKRELAIVNLLAGYTGAILKNIGATNIVVSPVGENMLSDVQIEKMKETITQRISGDNAGMPLIFPRAASVDSLGANPKEMLLQETDMHAVARICAAMGLSPMVLGLPDPGKTYSNYREAQRAAWINAVIPMHDLIADTLMQRGGLCERFDPQRRLCLRWDYSNVEALAEDQKEQSDRSRGLFKDGISTRNESRAMVGLPPVEGGDVFFEDLQPGPDSLVNQPQIGINSGSQRSLPAPETAGEAEDSAA